MATAAQKRLPIKVVRKALKEAGLQPAAHKHPDAALMRSCQEADYLRLLSDFTAPSHPDAEARSSSYAAACRIVNSLSAQTPEGVLCKLAFVLRDYPAAARRAGWDPEACQCTSLVLNAIRDAVRVGC